MIKGIPPVGNTQNSDDNTQPEPVLPISSNDDSVINPPAQSLPVANVDDTTPNNQKTDNQKSDTVKTDNNKPNDLNSFDDVFSDDIEEDDFFGGGLGGGAPSMSGDLVGAGASRKPNNAFGGGLGGGGAFGGNFGAGGFGAGGAGNMSREDRTKMIKRAYKDVLGREAQTRDINYYKYGTQNEEQVRAQLLKSDEHKDVMKKGRKFDEIKTELEVTKTQLSSAQSMISDRVAENETLKIILEQKNAEITRLRASNASLTTNMVNGVPSPFVNQSLPPVQPSYSNPKPSQGYQSSPYQMSSPVQTPVAQPTYTQVSNSTFRNEKISTESTGSSIPTTVPVSQSAPYSQAPVAGVSTVNNTSEMYSSPVAPTQPYTPLPAEYTSSDSYTPPLNPVVQPTDVSGTTSEAPKKDIFDRIASIFF